MVNKENLHGGAAKPAIGRRHWSRIHHSRLFWVGVFLFLVAITIYVLSDDLSWRSAIPIIGGALHEHLLPSKNDPAPRAGCGPRPPCPISRAQRPARRLVVGDSSRNHHRWRR
jgi:hypothetical protein